MAPGSLSPPLVFTGRVLVQCHLWDKTENPAFCTISANKHTAVPSNLCSLRTFSGSQRLCTFLNLASCLQLHQLFSYPFSRKQLLRLIPFSTFHIKGSCTLNCSNVSVTQKQSGKGTIDRMTCVPCRCHLETPISVIEIHSIVAGWQDVH